MLGVEADVARFLAMQALHMGAAGAPSWQGGRQFGQPALGFSEPFKA